jgi:hypothetical protein
VLSTIVALALLAFRGAFRPDVLIALTGGGVTVATVGFFDDRYRLSACRWQSPRSPLAPADARAHEFERGHPTARCNSFTSIQGLPPSCY